MTPLQKRSDVDWCHECRSYAFGWLLAISIVLCLSANLYKNGIGSAKEQELTSTPPPRSSFLWQHPSPHHMSSTTQP
jgi:hypothetical protein